MGYYYIKNGDIHGPISLTKLCELAGQGTLPHDAQVCEEGTESWEPLSEVVSGEEIPVASSASESPLVPSSAPPPMKKWEYAVVPFVASIAHNQGSNAAASQLEDLIHSYA